jgi:hypothetical protein
MIWVGWEREDPEGESETKPRRGKSERSVTAILDYGRHPRNLRRPENPMKEAHSAPLVL